MRTALFVILLFAGCNAHSHLIPFNVNKPDQIIDLPGRLKEISGITFLTHHKLACVQDEKGVIFVYDLKKEKLKDHVSFAKDRDYEAIANVNDTIYVLCSNGELFKVSGMEADSVSTEVIPTFLKKENNCEGLCFRAIDRSLLIAAKGRPAKGTAPADSRAVYKYDIDTKTLLERPFFVIGIKELKKFLKHNGQDISMADPKEDFNFAPSEINIDPLTNDIYVLSSVGKTLLILDKDGKMKDAFRLDPEIFHQPEGLAFSAEGDLYISDEAKGGKANLIYIKRKK